MAHLKAFRNEYQRQLGPLFDEAPKAAARVAEEWAILHENGIVPQRPGKIARKIIAASKKTDGQS